MVDVNAPSDAVSQQGELVMRLEDRAGRLRRQANILLIIIVVVLIAGAGAFVFANRIATFDFQRHTAADEYAAAMAAQKRNLQEYNETERKIQELQNTTIVAKPFDDQLEQKRNELRAIEETELRSCTTVTASTDLGGINQGYLVLPQKAEDRLGELFISLPTRKVYFSDGNAANDCYSRITGRSREILIIFRRIQDIRRERGAKIEEFRASKQADIAPYLKRLNELTNELPSLATLVSTTARRAAEERVLGAPLGEAKTRADDKLAPNDWAQIIQSNLTRLASLAIMFALITVLVPQYRYNIRMAAFLDARADSIRMAGRLQPITHLSELEKAISVMTPNIDFGKAPATPIDQLIEIIKAVRH